MPISNALIQSAPRNKLMDAQMLRPTGEGSYLRQQFPQIYGFLGGLAGTAPDEMAGSVLDPNTAAVRQAAAYSYLPGLVASSAPLGKAGAGLGMLAGMTKGAGKAEEALAAAKGAQQFDNSALTGAKFIGPQDEALRLAQQRAALPPSQGGLGLPANNTPEQRAAAMGGKEMTHFSRTGGDYTTLDSGKFAIAPFDAVGTHVGSKEAAMDRFRNTTGTTDQIKGVTYPVTILGDKPLINQNGMPFGEDDLSAFLRKEGGHNWSDVNGGKMTYQEMNAALRKKIFEEQGYTNIPYFNEVEAKGSVSHIVPPENIRSRFAAFDPWRKTAAIAATMGVAAPDLLAAQSPQQAPKFNNSALMK